MKQECYQQTVTQQMSTNVLQHQWEDMAKTS